MVCYVHMYIQYVYTYHWNLTVKHDRLLRGSIPVRALDDIQYNALILKRSLQKTPRSRQPARTLWHTNALLGDERGTRE
jgi:hypothetical protein